MMIIDTTDGNNLRLLRRRKGLTQEEVADRLHIPQSAYAQIEIGITRPWGVNLQRLCIIFQVSPNFNVLKR
ncbi:helix-turn-helix domain-containing protein [Maribacter litoralis]|uniref:helix-turn-helix domain-containing protein n=1 Tax=Maribacter litoralis TaxID=2059726 RepID=UPI003F5CC7A2